MTYEEKASLISLIESYKPDGNYYDGYHSFNRKCDEAVCSTLDELISEIQSKPTTDNVPIITMTKQTTNEEIMRLNESLKDNTCQLISDTNWFDCYTIPPPHKVLVLLCIDDGDICTGMYDAKKDDYCLCDLNRTIICRIVNGVAYWTYLPLQPLTDSQINNN